ncbi:MAG TPA: hypothetical protein VFQ61_21215, partial [Polyangiaceae bacterium]|nr:hypothetical protein [Polyangiaceae bacterium]
PGCLFGKGKFDERGQMALVFGGASIEQAQEELQFLSPFCGHGLSRERVREVLVQPGCAMIVVIAHVALIKMNMSVR